MRKLTIGASLALGLAACGGDGLNQLKNQPPVAVAGPDASSKVGAEVRFDGSKSTDADGTIVSFSWDFGDGAKATGADVTHVFASAGRFTITLTVADDEGAKASDTLIVAVEKSNEAPVAVIVVSTNAARPGDEISFEGSTSTDDHGVVGFAWDFGDGATATTAQAKHKYLAAGAFTAKLVVTDAEGLSGEATTVIRVQAPPVQLPTRTVWTWGLVDSSQSGQCGGFQAAALTIDIPNPAGPTSTATLTEAGGLGGSTVYSGSYTAGTSEFTGTHSGGGVTETIEGKFDGNFTHFSGHYIVDAAFVCSNVSRAIIGTRTSPPP